jgi:hypothetical protein
VSVVCCRVEVSASGWPFFQRSPNECGVSYWMWSWILDNEEALAYWGPLRHGKKNSSTTLLPWNGKEKTKFITR